jgi:hypothetical protein
VAEAASNSLPIPLNITLDDLFLLWHTLAAGLGG